MVPYVLEWLTEYFGNEELFIFWNNRIGTKKETTILISFCCLSLTFQHKTFWEADLFTKIGTGTQKMLAWLRILSIGLFRLRSNSKVSWAGDLRLYRGLTWPAKLLKDEYLLLMYIFIYFVGLVHYVTIESLIKRIKFIE